jgi:hypothetical protein
MRAVLYTSSRRYLPWVAAWAAGENEAAPPPYLTDFVNASGGIDTQALESEIRSLETGYVS